MYDETYGIISYVIYEVIMITMQPLDWGCGQVFININNYYIPSS